MSASHLNAVRDDESYADILDSWDPSFYGKFVQTLKPDRPGDRVLDVGCGVGQVVATLARDGYDASGVDVAQANIVKASTYTDRCHWYDGATLPFPDGHFASVGALNVLEHVEDPEAFLVEVVRVTAPGGKVVISSPNFLRAIGWRDYHPRMRGLANKLRNARALLSRWRRMKTEPEAVRFERMAPIIREVFSPDDDAIVCTNLLDMTFFLRRAGCKIVRAECTDRFVPGAIDWILNATPLRYAMFNAFVEARRIE